MANYKHYYFCPGCTNMKRHPPGLNNEIPDNNSDYRLLLDRSYFYKDNSTSITANAHPTRRDVSKFQHYEVEKDSRWRKPQWNFYKEGCNAYLVYLGWVDQTPRRELLAREKKGRLKSTAKSKLEHKPLIDVPKGVICYMYDSVTDEWYYGESGARNQARPHIPASVISKIRDIYDEDKMIFGRGCAEVDALEKLFAARLNIQNPPVEDLNGCVCLARNKKDKDLRSMCNNCQEWTQKVGIVDLYT